MKFEDDEDQEFHSPLSSPSKTSDTLAVKPFQPNTKVSENRVIAHIDLDCFYVQVERSHDPTLKGKPVAVVQYNPFGDLRSYAATDNRLKDNGSIIAVSYEARALGVTRIMRGGEAKRICPDMILVQVPTSHGKADLTIYRQASSNILRVLGQRYSSVVIERASIDEVYLDVTIEAARLLQEHDPATFISEYVEYVRNAPTVIAGSDTKEMKMSKAKIRNGYAGQGKEDTSKNPGEITIETATNETSNEVNNGIILGEESENDDTGVQQTLADDNEDTTPALPAADTISWFDRPANQWTLEDRMLLAGTVIIQHLRKDVFDHLGFTTSAGIAVNKMLSKLASGMHKPNKQTLVPSCAVKTIIESLPFSRVQGFGGKLGQELTKIFGAETETMSHLLMLPRDALLRHFGPDTTQWILQRAKGIDYDQVQDRSLPISIGCSKSFRSSNILTPQHLQDGTVLFWLNELAKELWERVQVDTQTNHRRAKQFHVGFSVHIHAVATAKKVHGKRPDSVAQWWEEQGISLSKTSKLPISTSPEAIAKIAASLVSRAIQENQRVQQELVVSQGSKTWGITSMGLSVANFEKIESGKKSIFSYLKQPSGSSEAESSSAITSMSSSSSTGTAKGSQKVVPTNNRMMSWIQQKPNVASSTGSHNNTCDQHNEVEAVEVQSVDVEEGDENIDNRSIADVMIDEINDQYLFSVPANETEIVDEKDKDHSNQSFPHTNSASVPISNSKASDYVSDCIGKSSGSSLVTEHFAEVIDIEDDSASQGHASSSNMQQLRALHAKYLRDIEWDSFVALPSDLQQELLNEAMFHPTAPTTAAPSVLGHKRALPTANRPLDSKRRAKQASSHAASSAGGNLQSFWGQKK